MNVCVVKLNGWPETFDERVDALAGAVDHVTVVRSKPQSDDGPLARRDNVTLYDVPPGRGSYVEPGYVQPFVFALHVLGAVAVIAALHLRGNRQIDVIHALDYVLGGVACAAVSTVFSLPFVVSVRGLKEPRYRALVEKHGGLSLRIKYRILTALSGFVLPRADHVVTKSAYQVEFVRQTFGVTAGVTTVPTGVDFDVFDPGRVTRSNALADLDTETRVEPDDTTVLYLSKLISEKGPDRLFEFICEIDDDLPDDVVFVFVGEARSEAFEQRLRKLRDHCPERIAFYPHRVPFERVPALIADADAVTLFSESGVEGVPRILQEACAMGTPIIAPEVDGIADAFRGLPGSYLVDRSSPTAFRDAVLDIVERPPTLDREQCRDRFDIDQNYARYRDAYEQAIAARD